MSEGNQATTLLKNARIAGEKNYAGKQSQLVDICIKGNEIVKISTNISTTSDTLSIDLDGRFVMPGLIDCHTHPFLADANISRLNEIPLTLMTARATNILRAMIMRGFTSIRDAAGGDWGIKQAVEEGQIIGPRMFVSGRALSQTGGHGDFHRKTENLNNGCSCSDALAMTAKITDGVDQVRIAVREELRKGADQIKIMVSGGVSSPHDPLECDQYSFEEIRTAVEEAERRGTYVLAHAYGASAIKTALKAGVRTIEHGNLIDKEAADLAASKGAFVVPTLVTYEALADKAKSIGWSDQMLDKLKRVRDSGYKAVEICCEAGVQLGLGTDLLGDDFDRQSEELKLRSQVQSNKEVIKSATSINAKILQREGRLGEISVGAIADLLILDGDPVKDISVLVNQNKSMPLIMKNGLLIKDELSQGLQYLSTSNKTIK